MRPVVLAVSNDTSMIKPWGAGDFAVVFHSVEPVVVRCTKVEYREISCDMAGYVYTMEPWNKDDWGAWPSEQG